VHYLLKSKRKIPETWLLHPLVFSGWELSLQYVVTTCNTFDCFRHHESTKSNVLANATLLSQFDVLKLSFLASGSGHFLLSYKRGKKRISHALFLLINFY